MLIRAKGASEWERVTVRDGRQTVTLRTSQKEYRGPLRGDGYMEGGYGALVNLSAQVEKDGFEIKGCMSCRYFRFSGMSYDQTGGWAGYCALPGVVGMGRLTRVDDYCDEHDLLPIWASDRGAAQEVRNALWKENRFKDPGSSS
jgi:hypothetical protein